MSCEVKKQVVCKTLPFAVRRKLASNTTHKAARNPRKCTSRASAHSKLCKSWRAKHQVVACKSPLSFGSEVSLAFKCDPKKWTFKPFSWKVLRTGTLKSLAWLQHWDTACLDKCLWIVKIFKKNNNWSGTWSVWVEARSAPYACLWQCYILIIEHGSRMHL